MDKKIILAISGSQRNPSLSETMLDNFLEGLGEDNEIHKFYPHKMNIKPCSGCFRCWEAPTQGQCKYQDDFNQILEIYKKADYIIFATPLYIQNFPSTVKKVIDRLFISLKSDHIKSDDGTEHPRRFIKNRKAILLSSCGFPEIEEFDILKLQFGKMCKDYGWENIGNILISASGIFNVPKAFDNKFHIIKSAGSQLSKNGIISEETQKEISSYIIPKEQYREFATLAFSRNPQDKTKIMSLSTKIIIASQKEK